MSPLLDPAGPAGDRHRAAARRLRAARRRFDLSNAALRQAALDHIDGQRLASATLRAALDRLAVQVATPS